MHFCQTTRSITKFGTLTKNYDNRKVSLESQLRSSSDEKLIRMRKSQLAHLEEEKAIKMLEFDNVLAQTDIFVSKLIQGAIVVKHN